MPILDSQAKIEIWNQDRLCRVNLPSEVIDNPSLSAKAKGVYVAIFRLMEHCDSYGIAFTKHAIYSCFRDGKQSLDTAWSELESSGYLKTRVNSSGVLEYFLFEEV